MRKLSIASWALLAIACSVRGDGPQADDAPTRNKIEGTWQHIFRDLPALRQIKVINKDHFIWVTYDRESKTPMAVAGGTYNLNGKTYKELIEFGLRPENIGKEQTFNVEIEGDKLTLTGTLTNGMKLNELWTKVK